VAGGDRAQECRARVRERMREPLALPDVPDELPDPLASALRAADLDAVGAAISELPRRQRKAFLLRELGGLSYAELGAALGVSRPGVESLLFRARQHLRRALAGANAALVPVGLRDQLAQLVPGFGTAPVAAVPIAAKVAAVAGVGLVAAGASELPRHHVRRTHTLAPRVVRQATDVGTTSTAPAVVRAVTREAEGGLSHRAGHEQESSGDKRGSGEHHDREQATEQQREQSRLQQQQEQTFAGEDQSGPSGEGGASSGDSGGTSGRDGGGDSGMDGSGSGRDFGSDGH
jgi:hypothetical protein